MQWLKGVEGHSTLKSSVSFLEFEISKSIILLIYENLLFSFKTGVPIFQNILLLFFMLSLFLNIKIIFKNYNRTTSIDVLDIFFIINKDYLVLIFKIVVENSF